MRDAFNGNLREPIFRLELVDDGLQQLWHMHQQKLLNVFAALFGQSSWSTHEEILTFSHVTTQGTEMTYHYSLVVAQRAWSEVQSQMLQIRKVDVTLHIDLWVLVKNSLPVVLDVVLLWRCAYITPTQAPIRLEDIYGDDHDHSPNHAQPTLQIWLEVEHRHLVSSDHTQPTMQIGV